MSDTVVITTDDLEPAVRLRGSFEEAGYKVELLTAGENLADVHGEPVLLVLTGPLRERRSQRLIAAAAAAGAPVIGLAAAEERISREECRRMGLAECLPKPIDVEEAVLLGRRLVQRERLRALTGIVGRTEVMEEVLERIVQIASVDSTVLIQGESGTGKELVARGIHALSSRRHRPFIAVNVAALPDTLLESEASYFGPSYMINPLKQMYGEFETDAILINCHYPIDENSFSLHSGIIVQHSDALPPEAAEAIRPTASLNFAPVAVMRMSRRP